MDKWGIDPFKFKDLLNYEIRDAWTKYKRNFEYIKNANGEEDEKKLFNIFLSKAGSEVQDVFHTLTGNEEVTQNPAPYQLLMEKLDAYFTPKQHNTFARHLFWNLKPEGGETLDRFMLRIREYAKKCNFGSSLGDSEAIAIVDKLIMAAPKELKEKLLQKELTLDEVQKIVNSYQTVKYQVDHMGMNRDETRLNRIENQRQRNTDCFRCGNTGHKANDQNCPAKNKECGKCQKIGHFARKCLSSSKPREPFGQKRKNSGGNTYSNPAKRQRVRMIHDECENSDKQSCAMPSDLADSGKSNEGFIFSIGDHDELIWVDVGGVLIKMVIDSGCKKNVIDDETWKYLKQRKVSICNQQTKVDQVFRCYSRDAKPLDVRGSFETKLKIGNICKHATFFVIKNGSQALLGKDSAIELGVLKLGIQNPSIIQQVQTSFLRVFPKIKGVKLHIEIDQMVTPVAQHARRPPIALWKKIEDRLQSLENSDIIEKVDGYSAWVSPLVTVLKDSGEVRLCVDMRQANLAIKRENHLMPTLEEYLPKLKSARVFSRLDIKDAFHQVELEKASREITTFITHKGVFRYKRLMFGMSCAPEMFQKVMEQVLAGCEQCINYIDDILVFGKDDESHDRALREVLTRLSEKDVLLNEKKCLFREKEIQFLGHIISEKGVRPSDEKISSIKRFREPTNVEELRSFLGLVTYVGRFIKDLGTITAPLRALMKEKTPFSWTEEQKRCFELLKELVANIPTLNIFDTDLRTRVIADASPTALGAVLVQFKDDKPLIVSFASKSLTETEKRYCQLEKEALALVWAMERFTIYLIGRKFELETDHKPLEVIFGHRSRPCARIERWILRMQAFRYQVIHVRGKDNIADPFSRLVVHETTNDVQQTVPKDDHLMVLAIKESVAIDTDEIERETSNDQELIALKEYLLSGVWGNAAKDYHPFKQELGMFGDIVIRNDKLIVPLTLRTRMLELAHEGHPGESLMKRRLRDRVWWPKMDRECEKFVKGCEGCLLVSRPSHPEPMARRQLPSSAWIDIAIDFLGPLPSGEYLLVVIDYYSRYKEVEIMNKITAAATVGKLSRIFTRLGYPKTISLDNGRQFISKEFEEFCGTRGIKLNFSAPYWPQQNGEVERQNRSLLKRLKISHALKRDWRKDLDDYLVMYYTTPHSITGRTPTELCFGRTIRSKIPSVRDVTEERIDESVNERDWILKQKAKNREDLKRNSKESGIAIGDIVLAQELHPTNKLVSTFAPEHCKVTNRVGNKVTIVGQDTGAVMDRNVAHVKKLPAEQSIPQPPYHQSSGHVNQDIPIATPLKEGGTGMGSDPVLLQQTEPEELQQTDAEDQIEEPNDSQGIAETNPSRPSRSTVAPKRFSDYVMDQPSPRKKGRLW